MLHYDLDNLKKKNPTQLSFKLFISKEYSITKHFKCGCKTEFLPLTFQLTFASVP